MPHLSENTHTQTCIHQNQALQHFDIPVTLQLTHHTSTTTTTTTTMSSNVGDRRTYEDGDQVPSAPPTLPRIEGTGTLINAQKNYTDAELKAQKESERFDEGKKNSHNATDAKDERSIANRLAAEEKKDQEPDSEKSQEAFESKKDATLPVSHSNHQARQKHVPAYMRPTASSTGHQHQQSSRSNSRTYLMQPANTSNQDERK